MAKPSSVHVKNTNRRDNIHARPAIRLPSDSSDYQGGDNSMKILIGMVVVFASCHFLRLFLQCYYQVAANNNRQCINNGIVRKEIPHWLWPLTAINHTCLVLNSSVNFLLYCWLGSRFRSSLIKEFKTLFTRKRNLPKETLRKRSSTIRSEMKGNRTVHYMLHIMIYCYFKIVIN